MVENLEGEVWMNHLKYTDYCASNYGRIKHLANNKARKEKIIRPCKNNSGYLQFNIAKDGKIIDQPTVHRFVYECLHQVILPKRRDSDIEVNHIDENKLNNSIFNLNLLSHAKNCNYGNRNKKISSGLKGATKGVPRPYVSEFLSKRVGQYRLDGSLVKIWKSAMECSRNNLNQSVICNCCNHKYYTKKGDNVYKGYVWKYASNE